MEGYKQGDQPIPGYRLARFLGAGGYGQVWEARGPGGIGIALKVINLTGTHGFKELRAVGLVKAIRHPNLTPLYAFWLKDEFGNTLDGSDQGSMSLRGRATELLIAMGLGDKNLAQRLEDAKLAGQDGIPLDELLTYMAGAARAIDFLNQPIHALGPGPQVAIQHCDIKPANLLIVGNEIQVCDYGLARAISSDVRATAGGAAGTMAYCSPELIGNRPGPNSDQYALAISYYELRTGQLPLDEAAAIHAHVMGELDFSLVAPAECAVLQRSTKIKPGERFPTAGEMVQALRDATRPVVVSGQPPVSEPPLKPTSLDDKVRVGAEIVPEHELVRLLGRGGYGEVWEARGPGGLPCALKIVRNVEGMHGQQEYRSLDLVRELDHERLIRLRAYWLLQKDGSVIPYKLLGQSGAPQGHALVMACDLAAKSLLQHWQEYQSKGRLGLPITELVRITRQSAEAIDYLNENGIQHRDIKPENILLTKDLKVKVSDFGLAKVIEGVSAAIHSVSIGLTLAYAAPEMFDNRVTRWTDQYSLAITYYRLRTGKFPFPEEFGPRQMMMAHTEGRLQFLKVRPDEEHVLRRATSLDPASRYPNCIAMVEALESALGLSHVGTTSGAPPVMYPDGPTVEADAPQPAGVSQRKTSLQDFESSPDADRTPSTDPQPKSAASGRTIRDSDEWAPPESLRITPSDAQSPTSGPDDIPDIESLSVRPTHGMPTPNLENLFGEEEGALRTRRVVFVAGMLAVAGLVSGGTYWLLIHGLPKPPTPTQSAPDIVKIPPDKPPDTRPETPPIKAQDKPKDPPPVKPKDPPPVKPPDKPADEPGAKERAALANFRIAVQELDAKNFAKARAALVELQKQPLPSGLPDRIQNLLTAIDGYDADKQAAPSLDELDRFAAKHKGYAEPPADEYRGFPGLYRDLFDGTARQIVTTFGATTDWTKVAASTSRLPTPWAEAAHAEAVTELLRQNRNVPEAERALPGGDGPAELAGYRQYVSATRTWQDKKSPEAADAIAALIPAGEAPADATLTADRRTRIAGILRDAATSQRRLPDPAAPFTDSARVADWLAAAMKSGAALDAEQTLRMQHLMALAALTQPNRDLALGRTLTDALVKPASLNALKLTLPEQVQLWVMFARARETTPAGRAASIGAYARVFELVRDEPAAVPLKFLVDEIVKPLTVENDAAILGPATPGELKPPGAKLCVAVARHMQRFGPEWSKALGKDDTPADAVVRFFDRAATLQPVAEYIAARGLARLDRPRIDPSEFDAADRDANDALAADAKNFPAGLLRGCVDAARGKSKSDAKDQLELCRTAEKQFKSLEGQIRRASPPEDLPLFARRAGDNEIVLANLASDSAEKARLLASARSRGERALRIDLKRREVYAIVGCAIEGQASLLGRSDRFGPRGLYDQAVIAFNSARQAYGERATVWLHLGRCKTKWADDRFQNRPPNEPLDEALVTEAEGDLKEALTRAGETPEAVEAHYWLAKLARLRRRAVPLNDPKQATHHATVLAEFDAAFALARTLGDERWAETIALDGAVAALDEANRLAGLRANESQGAITDAAQRIEAVKPFSAPWHAYLRVLLLPLERRTDAPDYGEELTRRADPGLEACRTQDRRVQYQIRLRRAEERTFLSAPLTTVDVNQALKDAEAASKLALAIPLSDDDRAAAIGLMGLARLRIFLKATGPEREAIRLKARDELKNALRLAPQHPTAWQWKTLLGMAIDDRDRLASETQIASLFAELYRLYGESEAETKAGNAHEQYVLAFAHEAREDLAKKGPKVLRGALQKTPTHPDRARWQLALAEMLVRKGGAEAEPEARMLFAAGKSGLSLADQRAYAPMIERIRAGLEKK